MENAMLTQLTNKARAALCRAVERLPAGYSINPSIGDALADIVLTDDTITIAVKREALRIIDTEIEA
jgi:hypothetical protein